MYNRYLGAQVVKDPPGGTMTYESILRSNSYSARRKWGKISKCCTDVLKEITRSRGLSIALGELCLIDEQWYISHVGLLRIAARNRCTGIHVQPVSEFCDPALSRWMFKATVYKAARCKGFVGHGDADPSNVSPRVRGAELRVAETRAVNRALRKAYGVGICSVEELGSFSGPLPPAAGQRVPDDAKTEPVNRNGNHPLRDRLCLLIRQHRLDPSRVKAYAADYCDVSELRKASRQQVATFIQHLG